MARSPDLLVAQSLCTVGFLTLVAGVALLSVPWALIVGGGLLFVAGGLQASRGGEA